MFEHVGTNPLAPLTAKFQSRIPVPTANLRTRPGFPGLPISWWRCGSPSADAAKAAKPKKRSNEYETKPSRPGLPHPGHPSSTPSHMVVGGGLQGKKRKVKESTCTRIAWVARGCEKPWEYFYRVSWPTLRSERRQIDKNAEDWTRAEGFTEWAEEFLTGPRPFFGKWA